MSPSLISRIYSILRGRVTRGLSAEDGDFHDPMAGLSALSEEIRAHLVSQPSQEIETEHMQRIAHALKLPLVPAAVPPPLNDVAFNPAKEKVIMIRPLMKNRNARIAAVSLAAILGTTGLAVAGALPDGVQQAASGAAETVGLNLPTPDDAAREAAGKASEVAQDAAEANVEAANEAANAADEAAAEATTAAQEAASHAAANVDDGAVNDSGESGDDASDNSDDAANDDTEGDSANGAPDQAGDGGVDDQSGPDANDNSAPSNSSESASSDGGDAPEVDAVEAPAPKVAAPANSGGSEDGEGGGD